MSKEATKQHIVCIGAGRMGRGMAHVFAYGGYPVTLVDLKPRPADDFARLQRAARDEIAANMAFLTSLGVMTAAQADKALALITTVNSAAADAAIAGADVLLEGVPETRAAKEEALGRISAQARPGAIIASTTSTMLVTELQGFVRDPSRFLNAHFLNPAYLIPLVEISAGPDTAEAAVAQLMDLFTAVGKVPVRCAAAPGYIVPRLQALLMSECARMVEEGVATPEAIDKAVTHGFGPRYASMGVLEFVDWGGVDILYHAGHYLAAALDSPRHQPPASVDAMMADGRTGMREGQGFYDFRNRDVAAYQQQTLRRFVDLLSGLGHLPKPGV